jgi:hypothetical protein
MPFRDALRMEAVLAKDAMLDAGGNGFSQPIASRWREADDGPRIEIPHKATSFWLVSGLRGTQRG